MHVPGEYVCGILLVNYHPHQYFLHVIMSRWIGQIEGGDYDPVGGRSVINSEPQNEQVWIGRLRPSACTIFMTSGLICDVSSELL
jgi:hypothetical protein